MFPEKSFTGKKDPELNIRRGDVKFEVLFGGKGPKKHFEDVSQNPSRLVAARGIVENIVIFHFSVDAKADFIPDGADLTGFEVGVWLGLPGLAQGKAGQVFSDELCFGKIVRQAIHPGRRKVIGGCHEDGFGKNLFRNMLEGKVGVIGKVFRGGACRRVVQHTRIAKSEMGVRNSGFYADLLL